MSNDEIIKKLKKARKIVCNLCKEGRCPSMSIPVNSSDEDVIIVDAIDAAIKALSTGWIDVADKLPEDERFVWAGTMDRLDGPYVIQASYHARSNYWVTGEDCLENELDSEVLCWREIVIPELPKWIFEEKRKDEQR